MKREKPEPDEWGTIKYELVKAQLIKPWEFGELTYPDLVLLQTKGKPPTRDASSRKVKEIMAAIRARNYD